MLVLDDYHVIHNERIYAALIQLLARTPAKFHLAIASQKKSHSHKEEARINLELP
ncbi:MAG: hypothetical protein AB1649_22800 [Chloroflexota bacterium]